MEQKFLSHRERLRTPIDCNVELHNFPTIRKMRVQKVVNNHVVNKVEMKTIDRAEEMRPYRVSDFSIDNLLAVGAKLDPTCLTVSPLKNVDDIANTLDILTSKTE